MAFPIQSLLLRTHSLGLNGANHTADVQITFPHQQPLAPSLSALGHVGPAQAASSLKEEPVSPLPHMSQRAQG